MKRIVTLFLAVVMIATVLSVTAGAKGKLIYSDNFDDGFRPKNWLTDRETCHFEWDKKYGYIQGYSDAVVLQSNFGTKNNKWWAKGYISIDFAILDFDDANLPNPSENPEENKHYVTLWYTDLMEKGEAVNDPKQRGALYEYSVEIETGKATLHKTYNNFKYTDDYGIGQIGNVDAVIAEGQIDETIEFGNDNWYNIGWRIDDGKIECYFNGKLIMSSSVADGNVKYGNTYADAVDATVGSEKSAFVFINNGNWIALDNFEVWTPDYDFVVVDSIPGDANCDGVFDINDVTTLLQSIAGWDLETYDASAADVIGDDGNADMNDVIYMLQTIAGWEGCVIG